MSSIENLTMLTRFYYDDSLFSVFVNLSSVKTNFSHTDVFYIIILYHLLELENYLTGETSRTRREHRR